MQVLEALTVLLVVLLLSGGGWIAWAIAEGSKNRREARIAREHERTERLKLRLEAETRVQDRADEIYLESLRRYGEADPTPRDD